MSSFYIQTMARSSMLRRNVSGVEDTERVQLKLSFNSQAVQHGGPWEFQAICRFQDKNNREQMVILNHQTLMAIHAAVEREMAKKIVTPLGEDVLVSYQ